MTKTHEATKTFNVVEWYCDCCKEHIGDTAELDDGYAPLPDGAVRTAPEFRGFGRLITFGDLILCKKCRNMLGENVHDALEPFMFYKDGEDDG